eukprot:750689-Hanusia_phi.AAC.6
MDSSDLLHGPFNLVREGETPRRKEAPQSKIFPAPPSDTELLIPLIDVRISEDVISFALGWGAAQVPRRHKSVEGVHDR